MLSHITTATAGTGSLQTWLGVAAYLLPGGPTAEHTKIFSVSALWALPEPGRVRVGGDV